jgi:hypothetical protein
VGTQKWVTTSISLGQGLVEHILVISHEIMIGNYVKRKKK